MNKAASALDKNARPRLTLAIIRYKKFVSRVNFLINKNPNKIKNNKGIELRDVWEYDQIIVENTSIAVSVTEIF